jgi:hypothetical protein
MLDNPNTKNEWKSTLNRKINVYWWNNIKHSTTLYKSLQFLNNEKCYPGKIHMIGLRIDDNAGQFSMK